MRQSLAVATSLANAETTTKVIYREIFCTFDLPAEILSNREFHFANKTIQNLGNIVKVIHNFLHFIIHKLMNWQKVLRVYYNKL